MTMRWYGDSDPVTLEKIRQIPGVTGVVSAIYDVPVGEAWSEESIFALKDKVEAAGLTLKVIESVPVHEDIKLGLPTRDQYIENFCTTLRRLKKAGIEVVCYNFMPVFDWTRTELAHDLPDGSNALIYLQQEADKINPLDGDLSLPGWDIGYTKEELVELIKKYSVMTEEQLWENLQYFLIKVIGVCDEIGMKMAIHPDDPPWPVFGLPRIIRNRAALEKLVGLVHSRNNGITLCAGALGVAPQNDIPAMIREFGDRIHFGHVRNVKITGEKCFEESAHLSESGSLDMYEIMRAYFDIGFEGYIRPDHGRMIWGETGKPGYGLFDRALGAAYINGLWEAVCKENRDKNSTKYTSIYFPKAAKEQ